MGDKTDFEGVVSKMGQPKIYKQPWGTTRRFFVEFTNGQKAMFAAAHSEAFSRGDSLKIENATIDDDRKWLSVGEGATIHVLENNGAPSDDITLRLELGYVTKTIEEGRKQFYLCYQYKLAEPYVPGVDFRVVQIPMDAVWHEGGSTRPPSYSKILAVGRIRGDTFAISEICQQEPITKFETIVVRVADLKYHRFGADFDFNFSEERFVGSIQTPFPSSPAFNPIAKDWEGHVEVTGRWTKRGYMTRHEGSWVEKVYWQFISGKDSWDKNVVQTIQNSIAVYNSVEGFNTLITDLTTHPGLISYKNVSEQFKKLGFTVNEDEVRKFLWHQDLEGQYIDFLSKLATEAHQTNNDDFFFVIKKEGCKTVLVYEIPKEQYSTVVIVENERGWQMQVALILDYKRRILQEKEIGQQVGVFKTVKHNTEWENMVLAAVIEAQKSK